MTDLLHPVDFWHIHMANLSQAVSYGVGEIFTTTLNQLAVLSCPFSLILNFTPLYISLIYSVFFNKALQEFHEECIYTKGSSQHFHHA